MRFLRFKYYVNVKPMKESISKAKSTNIFIYNFLNIGVVLSLLAVCVSYNTETFNKGR